MLKKVLVIGGTVVGVAGAVAGAFLYSKKSKKDTVDSVEETEEAQEEEVETEEAQEEEVETEEAQEEEENKMLYTKVVYNEKDGVYNVIISGDIFIIPNPASTYHEDSLLSKYRKEDGEVLGYSLNDDDQLIDTWIVVDGSDNLHSHGLTIHLDDDNEMRIPSGIIPELIKKEYLPSKDDEITTFSIQDIGQYINGFYDGLGHKLEGVHQTVNIELVLRANQGDYRYRNHGTWEEVMEKVTK